MSVDWLLYVRCPTCCSITLSYLVLSVRCVDVGRVVCVWHQCRVNIVLRIVYLMIGSYWGAVDATRSCARHCFGVVWIIAGLLPERCRALACACRVAARALWDDVLILSGVMYRCCRGCCLSSPRVVSGRCLEVSVMQSAYCLGVAYWIISVLFGVLSGCCSSFCLDIS